MDMGSSPTPGVQLVELKNFTENYLLIGALCHSTNQNRKKV